MQIGPIPFDTGPGSQEIVLALPELNLSEIYQIQAELTVTKADTDVGDTLDVRLQFTKDNVIWHTYGRFKQVTGDMNPSTTAPRVYVIVLTNRVYMKSTEESHAPTGGQGASDLAEDSVRNVPFPQPPYDPILKRRVAPWRFHLDVTDGDNDVDFEGYLDIYLFSGRG